MKEPCFIPVCLVTKNTVTKFSIIHLCLTMLRVTCYGWCQIKEDDSVVVITHEPAWLLDWYWGGSTGKNVAHLIKDHLRGRCRLRMAGDLHHYMRHSAIPSNSTPAVQHLIVNGCGGAFLHPTHVFAGFKQFQGSSYEKMSAYPSIPDSRKVERSHKTIKPWMSVWFIEVTTS